MASILVATGFVRIDSDTTPALKALKALGAAGGQALSTTLLPATAAVAAGIAAMGGAAIAAGAAFGAFGAAVVPQFQAMSEASSQYETAQKAQEKADLNIAQAKAIATRFGIKYGDSLKITSKMSAESRREAEQYNKALGQAKSSADAAKDAQTLYAQKLAALPPATRQTAKALQGLKDDLKKWSDSLAGTTMPIFTQGIEMMRRALPKLTPFVKLATIQIKSFLSTLGEGAAGKIFREFGQNMQRHAGGAVRNFLTFGKNMIAGILGILNAFSPMQSRVTGGLAEMSERFATWSANLGSNQGFQTFMRTAQEGGPRVGESLRAIGRAFSEIASAAGPLAGVGLKVLTIFAKLVDAIPTPVLRHLVPAIIAVNLALKAYALYQAIATAATWAFATSVTTATGVTYASRAVLVVHRIILLAHAAATAVATAATWLWTAATAAASAVLLGLRYALVVVRLAIVLTTTAFRVMAVALLSSPIGLAIVGITALAAAIVWVATKTTWFQTAWKATWGAVQTAFRAVMGFLTSGLARFSLLLLGPLGALVLLAANWKTVWGKIQSILAGAQNMARSVGAWFSGPFVAFFKQAGDLINNRFIQPLVRFFTVVLPNAAAVTRSRVTGFFRSLLSGLMSVVSAVNSRCIQPFVRFFTIVLPNAAATARSRVTGFFGSLRDGLVSAANAVNNRVVQPLVRFFTVTVPNAARTMSARVRGFFAGMRDGIGSIWQGIQSRTKAPINWVITHVWNNGIRKVWGKITDWIPGLPSLGKIDRLASGGTIGPARPGMFNRPVALVGEGNPRYPEYVIPTDPKYAARAKGLWEAAGAHFMEDGGILGKVGGAVKGAARSAAKGVSSAVTGLADFLTDPVGKAKKLLMGSLSGLSGLGSTPWAKMVAQLPRMAVDGLLDKVKDAAKGLLGGAAKLVGFGKGVSGGSGVQRWSGVVQTALRAVGQSLAYTGITLRRMQQESGGNPTIVNKWDSNWQAGHPSVGLMQVIGPTFRAYAGAYRGVGPFLYGVSVNPLANVYSSMRYALAAYGSLPRAYNRAGGYANGTAGTAGGMHLFGERGPEMGFSPSGWRVLNARRTAGLGGPGLVIERLVLENHGVIGSQHEVENWLVTSLTELKRKGRVV